MITYKKGNLLEDTADALVNTVNCAGVMGKGIALAFRNAFPDNYNLYRAACVAGELQVGKLWVLSDFSMVYGQKIIVNLPTKKHWRDPSQYAFVEAGLMALRDYLIANQLNSIALPALGCGNGGLEWSKVKPMIEKYLSGLDADIRVYEPE